MKQLVMLGLLVFLVGCSSSGGESGSEPESAGETYPFSFAMEERNLCGKTSAFSEYEVIAYSDEGEIISRHKPDNQGAVSAEFDQSHVNLMIIRDEDLDKKGLDVTVLTQYPIGDLGTFTLDSLDSEDCGCQVVDVEVLFESDRMYNDKRVSTNLPSKGDGNGDFDIEDVLICKLDNGLDPLMFINIYSDVWGVNESDYILLENPSELVYGDVLDARFENRVGLDKTIDVDSESDRRQWVSYVTDGKYQFLDTIYTDDNKALMFDHERVEPTFTSFLYQPDEMYGANAQLVLYVRVIPIDKDTISVSSVMPEFDFDRLLELVENKPSSFDLSSSQFGVVSLYRGYQGAEETVVDSLNYLMPDKVEEFINFELPEDYNNGVVNDPESLIYQGVMLTRTEDISSLDEMYSSKWLGHILNQKSSRLEQPPAEYTYADISKSYFNF